jgi:uncharacterized protein (TIGR02145 family)
MKNKILSILLFCSVIGYSQVPNTETFTLDTVVKVVSPATNDLSACFTAATKAWFDPLYDSIGYAPVRSLKRFRNYTPVVGGCVEYGYLYNWYAATDARNIAPSGWHVPSDAELTTLSTYLGGDAVAGGKLKEAGYNHWLAPNTGADNSSGFTFFAGGYRLENGIFYYIGRYGRLWSSTEYSGGAYYRFLYYADATVFRGWLNKKDGFSIRCLMDGVDPADPGTVTGNDGKVYQTVKIGTQVWMAENLAETKYRDGTIIPTVTDNSAWVALTTGAKCAYNNDQSNVGCGE